MALRDGQSYTLLDTSTTDTLALNHDYFRPLGMQHFYDSFMISCLTRARFFDSTVKLLATQLYARLSTLAQALQLGC